MVQKQFTLPAVTVLVAGTSVPLSNTEILATDVIVTADLLNGGVLYVGDSSVDSSNGQPLQAGESYVLSTSSLRGTNESFDVSDIWVDSSANGVVARVAYIAKKG